MMVHAETMHIDWGQVVAVRDADAFRRLYNHYYHYFSFIGAKRGFASATVKDAINDVFAYVWENNAKLLTVANSHNYLVTTFLQKVTRAKVAATADVPAFEALADSLREPSVEAVYIQDQDQAALQKLIADFIAQLPVRQREIIYQKFYLGLSNAEIAAANNIAASTVYNTVYQTLEKLRAKLSDDTILFIGWASLLGLLLGLP